jgi:protoporphyrinogen oxidase
VAGRVIVIGAGPAGLTAAYKLVQAGRPVAVYEASPHVGGLARSLDLWGQRVDVGPHRFLSHDRIVNDHWHEVVGDDFSIVRRLTRIQYRGKFFHYPLRPVNALFGLGPVTSAASLLSYLKVRAFPPPDPKTFEEWVVSRFGRRLFEIFFKTYSEKVWGVPCARIDADWAAQRIKKLSLYEAVKSALLGDRSKKHKTLADAFAYPRNGTGSVYEKMAERVRAGGGVVALSTPVAEVLTEENGDGRRAVGVRLADGSVDRGDAVVSTMPLTLMVRGLKHAPPDVVAACDRLRYRNTILVYLEVDSPDLFPDNWIYVHSPEVRHGRVTNFRNWCPSLVRGRETTILCMEFWCFDADPIWGEDDGRLAERGEEEIRRIGLVPEKTRILNHHVMKLRRSYPVYETGYMEHLRPIQEFVNSVQGLFAIGRYGSFKYNNQDHSILMGLLAAREIVTGRPQGLWSVNTDTDYQEEANVGEVWPTAAPPEPAGASRSGRAAGQ